MKSLCIVILSLMAAVSIFAQAKTVTNADLEKFRIERVESEKKLRERYARLGLPSPEEVEAQNERRRAEMYQYSDQLRQARLGSQNDIVAQANALRTQIASIDAQIDYLRNQGGGTYNQNFGYSYGYAPNRFQRNRSVLPQIARLPPNMRTVQEGAIMYPSSQSLYNQSIGNVRIGGNIRIGGGNGGNIRGNYNNNRGNYRGGYLAPVRLGGGGGGYVQNEANNQLLFLEQTRAGLLAEWQILEEQARRAGIRID